MAPTSMGTSTSPSSVTDLNATDPAIFISEVSKAGGISTSTPKVDENPFKLFYLGLGILGAWMLIILILVRHYWLPWLVNNVRHLCCGAPLPSSKPPSGITDVRSMSLTQQSIGGISSHAASPSKTHLTYSPHSNQYKGHGRQQHHHHSNNRTTNQKKKLTTRSQSERALIKKTTNQAQGSISSRESYAHSIGQNNKGASQLTGGGVQKSINRGDHKIANFNNRENEYRRRSADYSSSSTDEGESYLIIQGRPEYRNSDALGTPGSANLK